MSRERNTAKHLSDEEKEELSFERRNHRARILATLSTGLGVASTVWILATPDKQSLPLLSRISFLNLFHHQTPTPRPPILLPISTITNTEGENFQVTFTPTEEAISEADIPEDTPTAINLIGPTETLTSVAWDYSFVLAPDDPNPCTSEGLDATLEKNPLFRQSLTQNHKYDFAQLLSVTDLQNLLETGHIQNLLNLKPSENSRVLINGNVISIAFRDKNGNLEYRPNFRIVPGPTNQAEGLLSYNEKVGIAQIHFTDGSIESNKFVCQCGNVIPPKEATPTPTKIPTATAVPAPPAPAPKPPEIRPTSTPQPRPPEAPPIIRPTATPQPRPKEAPTPTPVPPAPIRPTATPQPRPTEAPPPTQVKDPPPSQPTPIQSGPTVNPTPAPIRPTATPG